MNGVWRRETALESWRAPEKNFIAYCLSEERSIVGWVTLGLWYICWAWPPLLIQTFCFWLALSEPIQKGLSRCDEYLQGWNDLLFEGRNKLKKKHNGMLPWLSMKPSVGPRILEKSFLKQTDPKSVVLFFL